MAVEASGEPAGKPPDDRVAAKSRVSPTTGLPSEIAAGLASIFTLVGGVVFLIVERRDAYVRFYALQSILLFAVAALVWMSVAVLAFVFRQIPLLGEALNAVVSAVQNGFSLVWFGVYVVTIVQAFAGREWLIPFLGKIAKKQSVPTS